MNGINPADRAAPQEAPRYGALWTVEGATGQLRNEYIHHARAAWLEDVMRTCSTPPRQNEVRARYEAGLRTVPLSPRRRRLNEWFAATSGVTSTQFDGQAPPLGADPVARTLSDTWLEFAQTVVDEPGEQQAILQARHTQRLLRELAQKLPDTHPAVQLIVLRRIEVLSRCRTGDALDLLRCAYRTYDNLFSLEADDALSHRRVALSLRLPRLLELTAALRDQRGWTLELLTDALENARNYALRHETDQARQMVQDIEALLRRVMVAEGLPGGAQAAGDGACMRRAMALPENHPLYDRQHG